MSFYVCLESYKTGSFDTIVDFDSLSEALAFAARHDFVCAVVHGFNNDKIAAYKRGEAVMWCDEYKDIVLQYSR